MELAFPLYPLKVRTPDSGESEVWDPIRQIWVVNQPEEEIRQLLIQYLLIGHKVPRGLIAVEKEIRYQQNLRRRFDLLVYDGQTAPKVLIEIKAPQVELSEKTLQQLARYNHEIQAPHLMVTNGLRLLFFSRKPDGKYQFVPSGWYE